MPTCTPVRGLLNSFCCNIKLVALIFNSMALNLTSPHKLTYWHFFDPVRCHFWQQPGRVLGHPGAGGVADSRGRPSACRYQYKRYLWQRRRHRLRGLVSTTRALLQYHDDVIKWKHFRVTGPLCGVFTGDRSWPVNSPHKGQWSGALMFPLICAWINGWVNNGEAGDLRRHRAHYDVTVMIKTVFQV